MQTNKRSDLSEWPRILEGVDAWPKVKWPRRLEVPVFQPLPACLCRSTAGEEMLGYVVHSVEEANAVLWGQGVYKGTVEHAGSGRVRLTRLSYEVMTFQIAEIKFIRLATFSQEQRAC
jgi:hypothetical protein